MYGLDKANLKIKLILFKSSTTHLVTLLIYFTIIVSDIPKSLKNF